MSAVRETLVTGATGTVGRHVVAQLLDAGHAVRALTRDPGAAGLPSGADGVRGDLSEPHTLSAVSEGVGAVFLVWPFATAEHLPAALEHVARHARCVVYLSSVAVRAHERQAETLIARSGMEWTVLRPHAFMANALRWAGQIRSDGVVREPYGAAAAPVVHEEDIAAVAVRALTGGGRADVVHELTGPETLTQAEQVRVIGEVTGCPAHWQESAPQAARQRMLARGRRSDVVDGVLRAQARMADDPLPATSVVRELTGTPARDFREWVADHVDAFAPV